MAQLTNGMILGTPPRSIRPIPRPRQRRGIPFMNQVFANEPNLGFPHRAAALQRPLVPAALRRPLHYPTFPSSGGSPTTSRSDCSPPPGRQLLPIAPPEPDAPVDLLPSAGRQVSSEDPPPAARQVSPIRLPSAGGQVSSEDPAAAARQVSPVRPPAAGGQVAPENSPAADRPVPPVDPARHVALGDLGISPGTLLKAFLGIIYAVAEALMSRHLPQQGDSAAGATGIALKIVYVSLLLGFLFIVTGACMYRRVQAAGSIIGNAGFLCISLSFFAMMYAWAPNHLAWLAWAIGGIQFLVFGIFFALDLKGFYAEWRRREADRRRGLEAAQNNGIP